MKIVAEVEEKKQIRKCIQNYNVTSVLVATGFCDNA